MAGTSGKLATYKFAIDNGFYTKTGISSLSSYKVLTKGKAVSDLGSVVNSSVTSDDRCLTEPDLLKGEFYHPFFVPIYFTGSTWNSRFSKIISQIQRDIRVKVTNASVQVGRCNYVSFTPPSGASVYVPSASPGYMVYVSGYIGSMAHDSRGTSLNCFGFGTMGDNTKGYIKTGTFSNYNYDLYSIKNLSLMYFPNGKIFCNISLSTTATIRIDSEYFNSGGFVAKYNVTKTTLNSLYSNYSHTLLCLDDYLSPIY